MIKIMAVNVAMDVAINHGPDGAVTTELLFQDPQSGILLGVMMDSGGVKALKSLLDGKRPIQIAKPGDVSGLPKL